MGVSRFTHSRPPLRERAPHRGRENTRPNDNKRGGGVGKTPPRPKAAAAPRPPSSPGEGGGFGGPPPGRCGWSFRRFGGGKKEKGHPPIPGKSPRRK